MNDNNAFANHPPLDEQNYLKVRFETLRNKGRPESFDRAIDTLVQMRRNLRIIEKIGRIHEVGNRNNFMQTLHWLRGETSLSIFISVPQIANIDSIDDNISSLFEQHIQNLMNNLRSEPIYNQVELAYAIQSTVRPPKVEVAIDESLSEMEDNIRHSIQNAENKISSTATELLNTISQREAEVNNGLNSSLTHAVDNINGEANLAIGKLQQAQALEEWGKTYDSLIEQYEDKLYGRRYARGTFMRNWTSFKNKFSDCRFPMDYFFRFFTTMPLILKNITTVVTYTKSKLFSYEMQRAFCFGLIVVFALSYIAISVISQITLDELWGINLNMFDGLFHQGEWYTKITIYLPVAIILGIAYSFAVKNYRIYRNMIDQYYHRRTVARASQGIILSLDGEQNNDVRDKVAASAAQALFEHKNTGHLTKKEAESMSPMDILRIFSGRP